MADPPPTRKDVADLLENVTLRMRADPSFLAAAANAKDGLTVYLPPEGAPGAPTLGELDLQTDAAAITVTAETRNADANSVHVTLAEDRLSIGLGEGSRALRRDLTLPAPVDEERAVATLRNGILDIVLPLRQPRAAQR